MDDLHFQHYWLWRKRISVLKLELNREGEQPLYQQIAKQIRQQIRDNYLPIGARLPSIRSLARHLDVARLTVQSAYDELQDHGWIVTAVGRGSFVAQTAHPYEQINAVALEATPQGILNDMARIGEIEVIQSFAYAEPDENYFPLDAFWNVMNNLKSPELMSYGSQEGDTRLRVQIAALLRERGVETVPGDIMVTTGVTQGLSLVAQALTSPGDFVIVEQPTHIMFLHLLKAHQITPLGVPMDEYGPRLDILERIIIQYRPRFFYTIPNFHNPTGISMSEERRSRLLALAKKYGLILVEDDIYGLLSYDDSPAKPLKAQDDSDLVIHLGGFSKVLMPGLRLGYVTAPQPLHQRLLSFKHSADLCTPRLTQRTVAIFLQSGHFRAHLKRMLQIYGRRRDRLMAALQRTMPSGVIWQHLKGGFNCWLTLPSRMDCVTVQRLALKRGFAFTPGNAFWFETVSTSHLRICFARQSGHIIDEGIAVLGDVIREEMNDFCISSQNT